MKKFLLIAAITLIACGCSKKVLQQEVSPDILVPNSPIAEEKKADDLPTFGESRFEASPEGDNLTVYFDFDKHDLKAGDVLRLEQVANLALSRGNTVVVYGGCCPIGDEQYNICLGLMRAEEVKKYLASCGLPTSSIDAWSWGESNLISTNYQSFWENRRAEVLLK